MATEALRGPRRDLPGRAYHYRGAASPLHRLPAGAKLAGASLLGAAAVASREPLALAALLGLLLAGYRIARIPRAELVRDAAPLLLQCGLVIGLYALRDGRDGIAPGIATSAQVALFFLPGALLLRTTSQAQVMATLERGLPERLAFAFATSLRFVPVFARELREIVDVQILRGARLSWHEAWRPSTWRDAVACVGVPLMVRALHRAQEAALAAEIRGLDADEEEAT